MRARKLTKMLAWPSSMGMTAIDSHTQIWNCDTPGYIWHIPELECQDSDTVLIIGCWECNQNVIDEVLELQVMCQKLQCVIDVKFHGCPLSGVLWIIYDIGI